eukprot:11306582-Alexandrium_andersonii.AAC.1
MKSPPHPYHHSLETFAPPSSRHPFAAYAGAAPTEFLLLADGAPLGEAAQTSVKMGQARPTFGWHRLCLVWPGRAGL